MYGSKLFKAYYSVKIRKHLIKRVYNIVARVKNVARVKAHADFFTQFDTVEYFSKLIKAFADLCALSCHGFQKHGGSLLLCQYPVKLTRYQLNTLFDSETCMTAGVKIVHLIRSVFHSPKVVGHCIKRKLPRVFVCGARVQGVRSVRQNTGKTIFLHKLKKFFCVLRVYFLCFASARIAREKLKRVSTYFQSGFTHFVKASR